MLSRKIADKRLSRLIGRYLRTGVWVGEHVESNDLGAPQGGPLSPLLADTVPDPLDRELARRGQVQFVIDQVVQRERECAAARLKRLEPAPRVPTTVAR